MKNINEDLIKRSLLYMNYDSKKTLNENISNINLLTEAYTLSVITGNGWNAPDSSVKYTLDKYVLKHKDENFVLIDTTINGFSMTLKYVCGEQSLTIQASPNNQYTGTILNGDPLEKELNLKYCKTTSKTSSFDWMARNDNNYWKVLKTYLEKNDLVPYVKESSDAKQGSFYYWGKFIVWRNTPNKFITHGDTNVLSKISNYNGKYAGQNALSNIELTLSNGEKSNVLDFITKNSSKTKDWKDGGGVRNDPGPKPDYTPGGGGKTKNECKGTYSMGCITPEVGEAQQCLKDDGLYPYRVDNKFGSKTRDAVKAKIGKTYFTDADLQTICKTTQGGGGEDEYDFDKEMGGGSGGQEKEDTTWTGDVY